MTVHVPVTVPVTVPVLIPVTVLVLPLARGAMRTGQTSDYSSVPYRTVFATGTQYSGSVRNERLSLQASGQDPANKHIILSDYSTRLYGIRKWVPYRTVPYLLDLSKTIPMRAVR